MFVVASDVGKKREINEDYFLIKTISDICKIYIVCDGLGGYECGEVASKMCAQKIYELIMLDIQKINRKNITKYLINYVKIVNEDIYNLEKTDIKYKGMGTTLILVVEYMNKVYYLSVGDSRIYYVNNEKNDIKRITEDDTYVNMLLKTNAITYEESKNHKNKHMLTKAIGVFKDIDVEVKTIDENGYILLCTDGVTNMMKKSEILEIFKNNDIIDVANKIVDLANDRGGNDNITAVVVKIGE